MADRLKWLAARRRCSAQTQDRTHPTSALDDTQTRMTMSGLMIVARCASARITPHKTVAFRHRRDVSVLPLKGRNLEQKAMLRNEKRSGPTNYLLIGACASHGREAR